MKNGAYLTVLVKRGELGGGEVLGGRGRAVGGGRRRARIVYVHVALTGRCVIGKLTNNLLYVEFTGVMQTVLFVYILIFIHFNYHLFVAYGIIYCNYMNEINGVYKSLRLNGHGTLFNNALYINVILKQVKVDKDENSHNI